MVEYRITIPGKPLAQKRPRFVNRNGHVRVYDDPKCVNQKRIIALYAHGIPLITRAVSVDIAFHMPLLKRKDMGIGKHTTKPDLDNLVKLVLDALNGVVWKDDGLVWSITATKDRDWQHPKGCTEITILEVV